MFGRELCQLGLRGGERTNWAIELSVFHDLAVEQPHYTLGVAGYALIVGHQDDGRAVVV